MKTDQLTHNSSFMQHALPGVGQQDNDASQVRTPQFDASSQPGTHRRSRAKLMKRSDLLTITTQLAIMSKSGMDLADAVSKLAKRAKNPKVRASLNSIHQDLQQGKSFSAALKSQTDVYGASFVASVVAGEASGRIGDVLGRLRDLIRSDVRLRGTIRGALMYPAVLLCISIVVLNALVFFVLPQFDKVFDNMGAEVPLITRVLLDVGQLAKSYWFIELIGLGVLGVLLYNAWSFRPFVRWRHRVLIETRWLRDGYRPLTTGRVFRLMGTMLESGVPLMETVRIARRSISNTMFDEMFQSIEDAILKGGKIAPVLASAKCVPDGASEMIATAELTGELGSVMRMVGEYFEEEGERLLRDQVKLIEPGIIVGMGLLVAIVVASVMLPLFDLSSAT